jgi:zinc transporter ZupT
MIAIGLHKYAEAMSLSIALQKSFKGQYTTLFWLMFIFAFATPLGIALGLILSNTGEMVTIVFTSLAGGTFLYISCSELITEEFSLPGGRFMKLLAFLFGALVITMLWFLDK